MAKPLDGTPSINTGHALAPDGWCVLFDQTTLGNNKELVSAASPSANGNGSMVSADSPLAEAIRYATGSGAGIRFPYVSAMRVTGAYTIVAAVKCANFYYSTIVRRVSDTTGVQWTLQCHDETTKQLRCGSGVSDAAALTANAWQHVAAVLDGAGNMTFYVGGVAKGSGAASVSEDNSAGYLEVGVPQPGYAEDIGYCYGYKRALTPQNLVDLAADPFAFLASGTAAPSSDLGTLGVG